MSVDHLIAASLCGFAKLLTGVRALWLGSEPVARTRVYFANHRSHGDFVLIWASLPPATSAAPICSTGLGPWRSGRRSIVTPWKTRLIRKRRSGEVSQ